MTASKRKNLGRVTMFDAKPEQNCVFSGYIETEKGKVSFELYKEDANTQSGFIYKGPLYKLEKLE